MSKITEIEMKHQNLTDAIVYSSAPTLNESVYQLRIKSLLQLASSQGYTHLIIYGDREHYSNIHFLTGYDPRFEEALLILSLEQEPTLIVGNEGLDYSTIIPFNLQKVLFQSFSLVGQPRGKSKSLREIYQRAGIQKNSHIGIIGWKYFIPIECTNPSQTFEIPYYIVQELQNLVNCENLKNASDLMIHPDYGIRISLDVKELIFHEIAGTKASRKVLQTLQNLQIGESEIDASQHLAIDGDPLSVHPNINFGLENVLPGLKSPTYQKKLELGEIITVGMGYRRALVARTGLYVRKKEEIPPAMEGIVENFYTPYFKALCNWYEALHIGALGDEVFQAVKKSIGDFKAFKRMLLEWAAAEMARNPSISIETLIGIPYNPYEPKPYERWTLKGIFDLENELKVADELWDFFGGPGTYYDLLDCFEIAGIELRPEIDKFFLNFK